MKQQLQARPLAMAAALVTVLMLALGTLALAGCASGGRTEAGICVDKCTTDPETGVETCIKVCGTITHEPNDTTPMYNPSTGVTQCPNGLPANEDRSCPVPTCENPDEAGNCPDHEAWYNYYYAIVEGMIESGEITSVTAEELAELEVSYSYHASNDSTGALVTIHAESDEQFDAIREELVDVILSVAN